MANTNLSQRHLFLITKFSPHSMMKGQIYMHICMYVCMYVHEHMSVYIAINTHTQFPKKIYVKPIILECY